MESRASRARPPDCWTGEDARRSTGESHAVRPNAARLGDHHRPYYAVRFIHCVCCHPDSIGVRLWGSANRGSAARFLHSAGRRRPIGCAGVDYRRCHRRRAGLEEDPPGQHGLAGALQPFWYPVGSSASDESSSKGSEGRPGRDYHDVLRLLLDRKHTAGTSTRQSSLAFSMWILRRGARRSLWNEWAAAGCVWSDATVVSATLPGDVARIFSTGQRHWHGWLLVGGTLDSRRHPLLSALTAAYGPRRVPGQSDQSSPSRRGFSSQTSLGRS